MHQPNYGLSSGAMPLPLIESPSATNILNDLPHMDSDVPRLAELRGGVDSCPPYAYVVYTDGLRDRTNTAGHNRLFKPQRPSGMHRQYDVSRRERAAPRKERPQCLPPPMQGTPEYDQYLHRVSQRRKQLVLGKQTAGYLNYVRAVPPAQRDQSNPEHVNTPRAEINCSKRTWDSKVRLWRRTLHLYDDLVADEDRECVCEDHNVSMHTAASLRGSPPSHALTALADSPGAMQGRPHQVLSPPTPIALPASHVDDWPVEPARRGFWPAEVQEPVAVPLSALTPHQQYQQADSPAAQCTYVAMTYQQQQQQPPPPPPPLDSPALVPPPPPCDVSPPGSEIKAGTRLSWADEDREMTFDGQLPCMGFEDSYTTEEDDGANMDDMEAHVAYC